MKFVDLDAQYRRIEDRVSSRIKNVFEHGRYILGPEVVEFENLFAQYVNTDHAIGVANGTDALQLAMMALGVGSGDAVFVPAFTFFATAEAVAIVGATPVFVDVDENSFNLDPRSLEDELDRILSSTQLTPKAVIPVDLFGMPANYKSISEIASQNSIYVIADCAQSIGASIGAKMAGSFGDIATTSFFPSKPLGCYGDGGAVLTSSKSIAERLQSLRVHGRGDHKYDNIRIGLNSRLDTLQAAILLEKLAILDDEIRLRQEVAALYDSYLGDLVVTPSTPIGCRSAWAQYTVKTTEDDREALLARLGNKNIPTAIYYDKPLHLQPAFDYLQYKSGAFPQAERLCRSVFSLPMHPYLQESEIELIATALK